MTRWRVRLLWSALALYLLLLGAHWLWGRPERSVPAEMHAVELGAQRAAGATEGTVRLAWREWGEAQGEPVILLHGSPGSSRALRNLVRALDGSRRYVAPDLPGFGASSRRLPDYSIKAHARYVLELMRRLGIERAHFVGFSMGGGVALELWSLEPQRVESLVLLSSIGVQEHELLGSYGLNHMVHAAQLAFLWSVEHLIPHFGRLPDGGLDVPYGRNFFDTDQRPLREILRHFPAPMLILHGNEDFLVPPATAREHARIVPQSRLVMLDTDHFEVFRERALWTPYLQSFWDEVESGEAATRSRAAPERIRAATPRFEETEVEPWRGPAVLAVFLLLALATGVSEDLTCIGAGLLVAQGRLGFLVAVAGCLVGIFVGDMVLFLLGRFLGPAVFRLPPFRWWLRPERVERASRAFSRRGSWIIVGSRFLPGARVPTYLAAGFLRMSAWRFTLFLLLAVLLWTPALVGFAAFAGVAAGARLDAFRRSGIVLFLIVVALLWGAKHLLVPLFTYQGRRRLVGRWRRWRRWEFWPAWLFYPPLLVYLAWLGLRFRGATLFTAANPGLPAGGFIGESKSEILHGLAPGDAVPTWATLPPGAPSERLARLRELRLESGIDYPLVLKPDVGQRGQGVSRIDDDEAARRYLESHPEALIAQRYAPGLEFGVFYLRRPGKAEGEIFSITEKRLPCLIGDGRRSLRRLVLDDRRAVALADVYLGELDGRADEVPEAGEEVALVTVGTHARGAVFLDGGHHASEALRRRLDEISSRLGGFCFGRYDLRVPSTEALRRGEDLAVLELNGVTSESTDIYDPKNSLWDAHRILRRQWRLAFEIGAENVRRGARPTPLRELARLMWRHRSQLP